MSKLGRNDPCHCGSGKKYKKCCLPNEVETASPLDVTVAGNSAMPTSSPDQRGMEVHPYAVAKLAEDPSPSVRAQMTKHQREALKKLLTISAVRGMETDAIVAELRRLGIDGTPEVFLPLAEGRLSAWSIGSLWVEGLPSALSPRDESLVGLAACELWKRYCPERPSMEMVDDWVSEGYAHVDARDNAKAFEVWSRVWNVVRTRFGADMRTYQSVDSVFMVSQFFGSWIHDLCDVLLNAAVDDRSCAEFGIGVMREALERFADEDPDAVLSLRCDMGRLLFASRREPEGEQLLSDVIREHPDSGRGYACLSDELGDPDCRCADIPRAVRLLEEALARGVKDAEDWDIKARLANLRKSG